MYLVLHAKTYDFQSDRGERLSGVKVSYVDQAEDSPTQKGFPVMTITGDISIMNQISNLPGLYNLDFRQKPNSKGQPTLVLQGAAFSNSVDIFSVVKPK